MNSNLQVFKNKEFGEIRWIKIGSKDYAVGVDVDKALGYKDPNSAITRHCRGSVKHPVTTTSGTQIMKVIQREMAKRVYERLEYNFHYGDIDENFIIKIKRKYFAYIYKEIKNRF